jgi:hypothetical protein
MKQGTGKREQEIALSNRLDTLKPVLGLARGKMIGSEPLFAFAVIAKALIKCTHNKIAVLGVELFEERPEGYRTERISAYEVPWKCQPWREFVESNNILATEFARKYPAGDGYYYVLTASLEQEFPGIISQ